VKNAGVPGRGHPRFFFRGTRGWIRGRRAADTQARARAARRPGHRGSWSAVASSTSWLTWTPGLTRAPSH